MAAPDGYPGSSHGAKRIPTSDIAAYAPPVKVEAPVQAKSGIQVDPDDLQAFARPAAPQGRMPAPGLPMGGHCQHPFTKRWVDTANDAEGCTQCARTLTRNGWEIVQEWQASAVAAGILR